MVEVFLRIFRGKSLWATLKLASLQTENVSLSIKGITHLVVVGCDKHIEATKFTKLEPKFLLMVWFTEDYGLTEFCKKRSNLEKPKNSLHFKTPSAV